MNRPQSPSGRVTDARCAYAHPHMLNANVAAITWAEVDQMENSATGIEAEIGQTAAWPRRYTVVVLLALATAICYVDRVNISIAIIPLARDRGYDAAATGLILSSFFWGYIGPQMLGGWLADRFGGKPVLTAGVVLWTLGTLLTPAAAEISFGALLVMRAVLGLGESVHFPTVHSLAARWSIDS